ncbi:hypothetical protein FOB64_003567 [Candida albicans]|uniref:Uncharacterized protein n=1 Tax=Candida albicans TaxID=5476 RepID=A0A8H6BXI3_CANAX|nr:hypothetical protein FOB64_003567 [Candida albicans]
MKLSDLVNEIKNGNDEYYLTTQYDFDDPDRASDEEEGEDKGDEKRNVEEGYIEDDFDESANDEENNQDEMTAAEAEFRIKELYQPH